jgi:hypothetical protein
VKLCARRVTHSIPSRGERLRKDADGMKRLFFGLCLTTLGACTIGSPIASKDVPSDQPTPSSEEQLRDGLPAWCAKICAQLAPCPDYPPEQTCNIDCADYMSIFVGHGDQCVALGQAYEACLNAVTSCDQVQMDTAPCGSDTAYDFCSDDNSDIGPSAGTGGAGGIEPPVDVTPPGDSFPECDFSEGSSGIAGGPGTSPTPQADTCDLQADDCSDGSAYRLICGDISGTLTCNCFKDGEVTGSFAPTTGCPPVYTETDAHCGWNLYYQ